VSETARCSRFCQNSFRPARAPLRAGLQGYSLRKFPRVPGNFVQNPMHPVPPCFGIIPDKRDLSDLQVAPSIPVSGIWSCASHVNPLGITSPSRIRICNVHAHGLPLSFLRKSLSGIMMKRREEVTIEGCTMMARLSRTLSYAAPWLAQNSRRPLRCGQVLGETTIAVFLFVLGLQIGAACHQDTHIPSGPFCGGL